MGAALSPSALAPHQVIELVAPRCRGGSHRAASEPKRPTRRQRRLARRAAKEGRRAARGATAVHVDAYDAAALLAKHGRVWTDGADILAQREIVTLATYEEVDRIDQARGTLPITWWLGAAGWRSARALDAGRAAVVQAAEVLAGVRTDGFLVDE